MRLDQHKPATFRNPNRCFIAGPDFGSDIIASRDGDSGLNDQRPDALAPVSRRHYPTQLARTVEPIKMNIPDARLSLLSNERLPSAAIRRIDQIAPGEFMLTA